MQQDLLNALRLIHPDIPDNATTEQVFAAMRLNRAFVRGPFWWALSRSIRFAKSPERQKKVAEWICNWKWRSEMSGQQFPPMRLEMSHKNTQYAKSI